MRHLCSFYFLLFILSIGGCSTYKGADENPKKTNPTQSITAGVDSIVMQSLGDSIFQVLFSPDSVMAAKVNAVKTDTKTQKSISYKPALPMKKVTSNDVQLLQLGYLSDSQNYKNDTIIRMSPYIPIMELDFYRNGEMVKMTVSFSDATWNLVKDDKEVLNYNYKTEEPILKIYNNL